MSIKISPFTKETKDVTISVRITQASKDALDALASAHDITYNRYVAKLIEIHLEELEKAGELPRSKGKSSKK